MSSTQRGNNRTETAAISAFWHWWSAEGATALTAAVTTGKYGDLADTIGAVVKAIHPGLSWETGPGIRSRH
jgi:hypothetical protein